MLHKSDPSYLSPFPEKKNPQNYRLKKVTCTDFKNRLFFIILFSARWRHPKQTVSLERSRPGQCRSEFEGQQTSWRQVGRVLQNVKKLRKKWRWRRDTLIQNPPENFHSLIYPRLNYAFLHNTIIHIYMRFVHFLCCYSMVAWSISASSFTICYKCPREAT